MRCWLVTLGFLAASCAAAQPAMDSDRAADEAALRDQRLPTKGPELLQILRDRTPSPELIQSFKKHVAGLKAAAYTDRARATAELVKMGPVVRPLLENLLQDIKADAETVGRLRHVVDKFPAEQDFAAAAAAARLIVRDLPPGSLTVLLDFVPYATDEAVRQDVQRAINAVALVDKKPAPLLVAALKDASPARRAAAAEALVRAIGTDNKDQIDPLLADAHPLVRYQLGMALVEKHDKRGIPLLIDVLKDPSPDRVETALDLLCRAAGEQAPDVYYRGTKSAAELTTAWQQWDAKHRADLDLAKQLNRTELGFTLIATGVPTNKIIEIGPRPEQAVRWTIEGPRNPVDVQFIGANRLLIAEYLDQRVTERDFKGKILKQFPAALPVACQRLPNGHTFIVGRRMLRIVDGDGKDIFTWAPQPPIITTATRLRNGQIAVVTAGGKCTLLDPQGRELKSFQMGGIVYSMGGSIEVLPNGRILAPLYTANTIVEFDWAGTKHWQASVNRPTSASRLPNGNTLVTCTFDSRVIEIDRNGAEVWTYQTDGRPFRARRR